MTVEETLLIVLTVAVVLLIVMTVTVLVALWQTLKRFRQAADEMQRMAERSASAAERFAPVGIALVSVMQIVRMARKFKR